MSDHVDMRIVRHHLYCRVYTTLERLDKSADGETGDEIEEAMLALDALYVADGRRTTGFIDSDPEQ